MKKGVRTFPLEAATVDWIGTEDSYAVLHRAARKYLYTAPLSKLEKQLNPDDFLRIHRSCIVNLHRVRRVESRLTGDYDVHLTDGTLLRLSRSYVPAARGRLL